ncbi:DUF2628 domain-containing protein [Enterovirga rhinocerotis]|uniref:Uncharacterized protein DUF2628 n=1 Tax=Enterovirga rhinocerotis TaxID=1339210 RepID=A0A4R7BZV6_9HYPH|nr:DUF2628 domain-containing protein [Enterovirga rhinocerotis]TDR89757.1 uncharacterized protein DUF2628 [Enterovirga rhinocerotis]
MSASYTLHVAPFATPGDETALDRAVLVRDGFSWWAFLVPPLWFAAHRHWLIGLATLVLLMGFWMGLRAVGIPENAVFWATVLLCLLFGLEGASLRRWDYARQGRPSVDVVFAANEAEAEAKAFARWLDGTPLATPHALASMPAAGQGLARPFAPSPWARSAPEPVIGLFPDAEGRR